MNYQNPFSSNSAQTKPSKSFYPIPYIVDRSVAVEDVALDAVGATVVPLAALLVVGTAFAVPKII